MNEQTRYDLIDRYLQGSLEKDHPFFQQLQIDAELQEDVATQKLVSEAVIDYRLMQVEELVKGYRTEAIKPAKKHTKWLWWALPVVLIATLAPFIHQKEEETSAIEGSKREMPPIPVPSPKTFVPEKQPVISLPRSQSSASTKQAPSSVAKPLEERTQLPVQETVVHLSEAAPAPISSQPVEQAAHEEKKAEMEIPLPDPCASVHFKAYVHETRPCMGKSEGALEIQHAKGGASPYLYSIDKGKSYHKEPLFNHLEAGQYSIYLKDNNGCEGVLNAHFALDAKTCVDLKHYSFNPHVETWEIPLAADKGGNITIVDRFGNQLYLRNFSQNDRMTWDGSALNGQLLSAGSYVYTITYGDGSIERGNVTLAY